MKILSFAISVVSVSPTVIQLDTNYEGYFGISVTRIGNDRGPEWVPLMYTLDPELEYASRAVSNNISITTVDDQHIIAPNLLRQIPGISEPFIPIGFSSVFGRSFASHYMMIPKHRQLVIAPPNPGDFVHGGRFMTTTSISDEHFQVRVSVSLLNGNQGGSFVPITSSISATGISDFSIMTVVTEDSIPASIVQALYDDLEQRQIPIDPVHGLDNSLRSFAIIGDLTDEIIDTFPIIQFRIHGDAGQDAIIQLDGRDYIGHFDGSIRELLFFAGCRKFFGLNTLSKVALYIDNVNRRIGFGEPI